MAARIAPDTSPDPAGPVRLVLVDDHPVFLEGLADTLARQRDLQVVARTTRGEDVVPLWSRHRPDLVLLDLALPGLNGLAVLKQLRTAHPEARVLMLTSSEEQDDALAALDAGAAGYVTKRSGYMELVGAIREAHAGGRPIGEAMAVRIAARARSGPRTSPGSAWHSTPLPPATATRCRDRYRPRTHA